MSADSLEELSLQLTGQDEQDRRIESYSRRAKGLCRPPSLCQVAANVAGFPFPLVGRSLRKSLVRLKIPGRETPKSTVPVEAQLGSGRLRRKQLTLELPMEVVSHS